ncbi:MAG: hypothetical protein RBU37_02185 [Myxococcota bacterium]|jgi:hypothetical protein|nr:hypothetical protein [Myxococcota bacterium]
MDSENRHGGGEAGVAFETESAYDFLYLKATPIENIRLAHWRGEADETAFWRVLGHYQNSDGGWARGVDPEYTGQHSSIHSTIEALRILLSHQQADHPNTARTIHFLRQAALPDGSWQELPEVLREANVPEWYAPARFRIWETAMLAGYSLDLGYTELWKPAATYLRNVWPQVPPSETVHPYLAAVLLLGRSHADKDRTIAAQSLDAIRRLVRREQIDPSDCSWLIEVLDVVNPPDADDLIQQLGDRLASAQDPDGGVRTDYDELMRSSATFNALMAVALMNQRGLG